MTSVSVIIATHQRRALLAEALGALRVQDYDRESLEVIVAPDRCTDGTLELLADSCDIARTAQPPRAGKAAALNAAIEAARGELAIFMDDDMLPEPSFVSAHAAAHLEAATEKIAVTGYSPVVVPPQSGIMLRAAARRFESFHERLSDPARHAAPTDLNGANFSIGLENLRSLGGFNETYFFQRDDFELGARLIDAGFEIRYDAGAVAWQRIDITPETLIARAVPRAENDLRLAREFPWCVPYLPFGRAFAVPAARLRWRLIWEAGEPGAAVLEVMRSALPGKERLVGLAYTTKYVATLRRELRAWGAMQELACRR